MPKQFDLEATGRIARLLTTPLDRRDEAWQTSFLTDIVEASLAVLEPQIQLGPDGFPYFLLRMPAPEERFEAYCLSHVLDHCVNSGVGVAVLSGTDIKQEPIWVFSLGDLWSIKTYGSIHGDPIDRQEAAARPEGGFVQETLKEDREILWGTPAEEFLPSTIRNSLGRFLKASNVRDPAIALLVDAELRPSRNLVFNLTRDQFRSDEELEYFLRRLSWFLPRNRAVMLNPGGEKTLGDFTPLLPMNA